MKSKGLFLLLFLFPLTVFSRPIGEGLSQSQIIDFSKNWNRDLEAAEKHPLEGFSRPYWRETPENFQRTDPVVRRRENALRWFENSVQWDLIYFDSENLDQTLGFKNSSTGISTPLRFQTRDFALELTARLPVFNHYNGFVSVLGFRPEEVIKGNHSVDGYALGFGNLASSVEGLSETQLYLTRIGNERVLSSRDHSRWTLQGGLSHFKVKRFSRLRGTDQLGLNQSFSSVLPTDPIQIEQGEETYDKDGLGGFLGFEYRSILNHSLSYATRAHLHLLSTQRETSFSNQKISTQGFLDSTSSMDTSREGNALLDLSFQFFKALKDSYRFSLGIRYLEVLEGESPRLNGTTRDRFALKGVQASFQRFF